MKDPAEALNHHHARDKLLICDLLSPLLVLRARQGGREGRTEGDGVQAGERRTEAMEERGGREGGEESWVGSVVEVGGGGKIVIGHSGVWRRQMGG